VLSTFVLSGFTMYLLVLRITRDPWAALLSGTIYAFAPYRIHALAAGWIPLLPTQWLPLTVLYLGKTLDDRRLRPAALAGLFAALCALSSWYYAYMLAIILPIYLLVRARPWREYLPDRRLWRAALVFVGVVGVLTVPVLIPALGLSSQTWTLGYADRWSASLDDLFLPNIYQPLWGQFFLKLRSEVPEYPWYAPGFIYLGVVPLVLTIVAFLPGARRSAVGRSVRVAKDRAALAWCAIVSAILALGTTLHLLGQRVYIPVPAAIEQAFSRLMIVLSSKLALHPTLYSSLRASGAIPIPLPGFLAFLFLPLFSAMRHWYRFGIITTLAVAVLAGIGAAVVLRRSDRKGLVGALLIALVLADFLPAPLPYGLSYTNVVQPVDQWLKAQPGDFAVMQFPLARALNGPMLYRGIDHGKRMTYGHGTFYPPDYLQATPMLAQFPAPASLDLLKQWGVRYIVVGSRAFTQGWGDLPGQTWDSVEKAISDSGRLRLVQIFEENQFWKDENVSSVLRKELAPNPISADKVYVYELDG